MSQQINKAKLIVEDLEFNVIIDVDYDADISWIEDKDLIETYGEDWCQVYYIIDTDIKMPYPEEYSLNFHDSLGGIEIHTWGKYANQYEEQIRYLKSEITDSINNLIVEIKEKGIEVKSYHKNVKGNAEVCVSEVSE